MREGLTLTKKEEQRARVLTAVLDHQMEVAQAAAVLGVSERQLWRLLRAYREEGPSGLVHGNRGRASPRRLPAEDRAKTVELATTTYAGFNASHMAELLVERDGLSLSRASVQRILQESGLTSGKKRRPRHRSRRERRPQEGMLIQLDGSHHDWLEGRGPRLVLLGAIDDATSSIAALRFHHSEDSAGYFLLLGDLIRNKGLPLALYADKHGVFRPTANETVQEQLTGHRDPSQFGRAMAELAVSLIFAHSPQAKGRIERLWGTLQSRLVAELRLARCTSLEEANRFLDAFVPRFNARFAVTPANPGSAYRPLAKDVDLEATLCRKHYRIVQKDNTVRCFPSQGQPLCFQILPGPGKRSYQGLRVEVRDYPDGRAEVLLDGRVLPTRPLTLSQRLRPSRRVPPPPATPPPPAKERPPAQPSQPVLPWKPPPDHPWRKSLGLTKSLNT
jgi:transposase